MPVGFARGASTTTSVAAGFVRRLLSRRLGAGLSLWFSADGCGSASLAAFCFSASSAALPPRGRTGRAFGRARTSPLLPFSAQREELAADRRQLPDRNRRAVRARERDRRRLAPFTGTVIR